ncbi:MAG: hypothetical protein PHH83_00325 [Patescibacteria group bacterium]|nr:hypothetical protein [Patescibacteria group bacterium]
MTISIDYNYLYSVLDIFRHNPIYILGILIYRGAWLLALVSLFWGLYFANFEKKRRSFINNYEYSMIAIDVPKNNEQNTKAIEELFNTIHGIKHGRTNWAKYVQGSQQLWISLEIVSIEGYIQYLVRAPSYYMGTIISTIYAHYPEAEITEVEDYMSLIPDNLHTKEAKYKPFLMDIFFKKDDFYPIKTFSDFEHGLSQTFVDPLASLLEIMSKIGPGEFLSIVILARPSDNKALIGGGEKTIGGLMGRASKSTSGFTDKVFKNIDWTIDYLSETIYKLWGDVKDEKDIAATLNLLTSREKATIAAIENKLNKLIYEVKIKTCYLAPADKYTPAKGRWTIQGFFKQFENFNQFDFKKNTDPDYWKTEQRKKMLTKSYVRRFKLRDTFESKSLFLSTEELATLYHFPTITVKAPMIRTTTTKTVEPPSDLPLESQIESGFVKNNIIDEKLKNNEPITLKDLQEPVNIDMDNKRFEAKFAKDKNEKNKFIKEFKQDEDNKKFNNVIINNQQKTNNIIDNNPPDNLPIIE